MSEESNVVSESSGSNEVTATPLERPAEPIEAVKVTDVTADTVENQSVKPDAAEESVNASSSENADKEVANSGTPDDPERQKKVNPIRKRIKELTNQKRELRDRAEAAERLVQQMQKVHETVEVGDRPSLEAFNYDEAKYSEALDDFNDKKNQRNINEALTQRERAQAQNLQAEAQNLAIREFTEKSNEFAVDHADYFDLVKNPAFVETFKSSTAMQQTALTMPNSPDIMYHLAKNPALAQELAMADGFTAAARIGQISAQLSSPIPTNQQSKAPQPVKPVGSSANSESKALHDMNMTEFMKARGFVKP